MNTKISSPKPMSRRSFVAGTAAGTTALLAAPALAQRRQRIGVSYGIATLDSSADAVYASIPMKFGFYAEEGLDVEIMPVGGTAAATNLMVSGQATAMVAGSVGIYSAVSNNLPVIGFMCPIPDYYSSYAVMKDGPIKKFEDIKGKTVGISSPVFQMIVEATATHSGWNPKKDLKTLVVGTSLPALDALKRGRVDALLLWDAIYALFEANGTQLTYFVPEPFPRIGFSQANSVMKSTIEKQPELIAKLSRAMAKSIVIMASAEPAELTKLHFQTFPASRPAHLSESQLIDLDGRRLAARKKYMRLQQHVFDRTEKIGDATDAQVEFFAKILHEGGAIAQALPASQYFTRQFIPTMNDIDFADLIDRGRKFRMDS